MASDKQLDKKSNRNFKQPIKLLVAGGGTGGHLYPALAMAEAFKKKNSEAQIEFVGTERGLEKKIVPPKGYRLHFLKIGPLNSVSALEKLKTLFFLPYAFFQALLLLLRYRPHVILGVGGYASGPVLLCGALLRFPTVIWEPNAYPGLTNRWLSKFVTLTCAVFSEALEKLKGKNKMIVAMPVRAEIENIGPRISKTASFKILFFGGSQGSRALNNIMLDFLKLSPPWAATTEIVWQTGAIDYERIQLEFSKIKTNFKVEILDYINDMDQRYRWADLVISRSGTGTLSELCAAGVASLLIPLPTAADDHQRRNAEILSQKNAARMILQHDLTAQKLMAEIEHLQDNPDTIMKIENAAKSLHQPHGAEKMADRLVNVALHQY